MLFLQTKSINAQSYNGFIIDLENNAIPFASLSFTDKLGQLKGGVTNIDGTFNVAIDAVDIVDTITISCIGFITKRVPFLELKVNEPNVLRLEQKLYDLGEVIISSNQKYKENELGTHKNKSDWGMLCDGGTHGYEIAVRIHNTEQKVGTLKTIRVRLAKESDSSEIIRIHVYDIESQSLAPNQELLQKAIYAKQVRDNQRWLEVDLEKYQINFPLDGFFVGVEFLPTEELNFGEKEVETEQVLKSKNKKEILQLLSQSTNLCIKSGRVKNGEESKTWRKANLSAKWKKEELIKNVHGDYTLEAQIGATIIFKK